MPSTLNDIQFNAFSDLDLENIYVPKTYEMVDNQKVESSISTVDFGDEYDDAVIMKKWSVAET